MVNSPICYSFTFAFCTFSFKYVVIVNDRLRDPADGSTAIKFFFFITVYYLLCPTVTMSHEKAFQGPWETSSMFCIKQKTWLFSDLPKAALFK